MITIDRAKSPKQGMSSLFVLCKEGEGRLQSAFVDEKLTDYINQEYSQNHRTFFAVDRMGCWDIVAVVENDKSQNKRVETMRRLGARLLDFCDNEHIKHLQLVSLMPKEEVLGFMEGMLLASYTFDNYKTDPKRLIHPFDKLTVVNPNIESCDVERILIIARGVEKCKDLVNEPYCSLNAEGLAAHFVNMSHEAGIEVEVWHKDRIEAEKMGGLLAVNKGSVDPPTFTVMKYSPKGAVNPQPVVLVGKGLVYDTGGLNLKPGDFMNDMKEDMAGAAMMASAIYVAALLGLPLNIVGLFPSTDNRPCGNAYASGDIINMYDGTNVEVVNTDAEGRMILADALAYAKTFSPMLVIDAATLTGAASRAIGSFGIAAVEKDAEEFMSLIKQSGERTYERIAEFPFWEEYDKLIESDIADIKNCGPGEGGMITAGKFLAHFTSYPYIHLDIAGVAMFSAKRDYINKGASGYGVRLMTDLLTRIAQNNK